MKNKNTRREFIKNSALATAGLTLGTMAMSAKSYARIPGANERLTVAIAGLGRRRGAFFAPISRKDSNVELLYLCDPKKSQLTRAAQEFEKLIDYKPKLEADFFKVIGDKNLDVLINATPDHWHAPGTWMANEAGKHVYVEKPCSHNPNEGEVLMRAQEKYGKVVQMGNQQRSSPHTIEIIKEIHNGIIGETYLAKAFYTNARGRVINPTPAAPPEDLDWNMWQGPAPRKAYEHNTWDYNWHWYGWEYGTAETGNNATHEYDVARWALQVEHPEKVIVDADKYHWKDDGWTMYDTMDSILKYPGGKTIKWDGKSRNGNATYKGGRGTIIYGTEGSVWVDRGKYILMDRGGKVIRERKSDGSEGGTQLGGGGDMSTIHVMNFFNAIRGKEKQNSTIQEGAVSTHMCHLSNIAYRVGEALDCDPQTGRILKNKKAMKLWSREYEKGWEPKI